MHAGRTAIDDDTRRYPKAQRLVLALLAVGLFAGGAAASIDVANSDPPTSVMADANGLHPTGAESPAPTAGVGELASGASSASDPAAARGAAKSFCSLATAYVQQIRHIQISLADPKQLRSLLSTVAPATRESVAVAAREVQADVVAVLAALDQLRAALEAANYELAKLSPDMVTKLMSPSVQANLDRIDGFVRKACA